MKLNFAIGLAQLDLGHEEEAQYYRCLRDVGTEGNGPNLEPVKLSA